MYFFTVSQSGISGMELAINMGVDVTTARLFLGKIKTAYKEQNDTLLSNKIAELTCGNLGGIDEGGKCGTGGVQQGKNPFELLLPSFRI